MNMPANSLLGFLPTERAPRGGIPLDGQNCTRAVAAQFLLAGRGAALAGPLLASMAGLAVLPSVFAKAFGLI